MALTLEQIVKLASDQFNVPNAAQSIVPASELADVFSPPHHGPQNVPIHVDNNDHGDNFTHYPIVNSCISYIFLPHTKDEVRLFDFHYNGPSQKDPSFFPIELEALPEEALEGSGFQQGFKTTSTVIFNQGDPQPIAIHLSVMAEEDTFVLQYIVVSTDADH